MTRHPRTWAVTVLTAVLVAAASMLAATPGEAPSTASAGPTQTDAPAADAPTAAVAMDLPTEDPGGPDAAAPTPVDTAPDLPPVPSHGSPEGFRVADGSGPVVGTYGEIRTYTVEVQAATGVSLAEVLPFVRTTLEDPDRGWTSHGEVKLQWVDDVEQADLRVVVATATTVDRHCAQVDLETYGVYSCWDGQRTMLNARRWEHGARDFGDDLSTYRTYLVNHEVGHALGRLHGQCPSPGAVAPVMMQQTVTTGACEPNGWPWPRTEPPA